MEQGTGTYSLEQHSRRFWRDFLTTKDWHGSVPTVPQLGSTLTPRPVTLWHRLGTSGFCLLLERGCAPWWSPQLVQTEQQHPEKWTSAPLHRQSSKNATGSSRNVA